MLLLLLLLLYCRAACADDGLVQFVHSACTCASCIFVCADTCVLTHIMLLLLCVLKSNSVMRLATATVETSSDYC
jgi:hypothetical protein